MRHYWNIRHLMGILTACIVAMGMCSCGGSSGSSNNDTSGNGGGQGGQTQPSQELGWSSAADLSGAIGIVLQVDTTNNASTLLKIGTDGTLANIFDDNDVVFIYGATIGTDNYVYVYSSGLSYLNDPSENSTDCALVRMSKNNTMTCMETEGSLGRLDHHIPLQFDARGNVYYLKYDTDGTAAIRMFDIATESAHDLYRSKAQITRYFVTSQGSVYVTGYFDGLHSLASIVSSDTLNIIQKDTSLTAILEMPDGTTYTANGFGVKEIEGDTFSDTYYITANDATAVFDVYNNSYDTCVGANEILNSSICSWSGGLVGDSFQTASSHVYVVTGSGDTSSLWQYWPEVKPVDLLARNPTTMKGYQDMVFFAGTNFGEDEEALCLYDENFGVPITVINELNYDVDSFDYSPEANLIFFTGNAIGSTKMIFGIAEPNNFGNIRTIAEDPNYKSDMNYFNVRTFK